MDVENMSYRLSQMREKLAAMRDQLSIAAFTGTSDDERIQVTVDAAGRLTEVSIDPRVFRNPDSEGLAEEILVASRRATACADEQVAALHKTVLDTDAVFADCVGDPLAVINVGRRLGSVPDGAQNAGGEG